MGTRDEKHRTTAKPLDRNAMARRRTALAFKRTRFASDRTLMAWVRTSLALISFGFSFFKFFQFLGKTAEGKAPWSDQGPRNVGLALITLGTVMVVVAAIQNYKLGKRLSEAGEEGPRVPGALVVAAAVGLIGCLAIIDLVFRGGWL